jgi:hypothetical protein
MTNKFTLEQVQTIVAEAQEAAQAETMTMAVRRGVHFPCGFAWVETTGIRSNSTLGKHLIACGFEKSWKSGVLQYWNPSKCGYQSVDLLSIGAQVFAKKLRDELGIECYPDSRLD